MIAKTPQTPYYAVIFTSLRTKENNNYNATAQKMEELAQLEDGYLASNDVKKLNDEQFFIRKKIDETTREIKQLENNMSFFSNAGEDNPLVKGVLQNIAQHEEDLKVWKKKLSYLTSLEY